MPDSYNWNGSIFYVLILFKTIVVDMRKERERGVCVYV